MKTKLFKSGLLLGLLFVLLIDATSIHAAAKDTRSWVWTRWDVVINQFDVAANRFHVKETHQIRVTQGSFAGGDRSIDLSRLTAVENIHVRDGSTDLRRRNAEDADSCGLTAGIFCVFDVNGERDIYWNFTARTAVGETRTITVEYDISGALRAYQGADQFFWSPLAGKRDFGVEVSRVTVTLPPDVRILDTYVPSNWTKTEEGSTVIFNSGQYMGGDELIEIGVNIPHNPTLAVAPWQVGYDRLMAASPAISLGASALAILAGIGGMFWIFLQYSAKGRDPQVAAVPEYLTEPPSNQSPGVVGTLLDESADIQDIIATLMDLAQRGYVVIEQIEKTGLGALFGGQDFVFHRTEKLGNDLRAYEQQVLSAVFAGRDERAMSDMKNKFYTEVPALKAALYREVVSVGYFAQSPDVTRTRWTGLGLGLMILGGALAVFILVALKGRFPYERFLALPFIALAIVGLFAAIMGRSMVAKTASGALETAKWRAFKTYLANIKKYTSVDTASQQFSQYIGYAVAFGLEKQWIKSFSGSLTSMPGWYYYPYYYGRPYYRGWSADSRPINQEFGIGGSLGQGGLNNMSQNLTDGLNHMSSGLTTMLNQASGTMSSTPSSSGSGGFSGGGSSGGGSAGGH